MYSKCFKTFILALLMTGLGGSIVNAGYIVRVFYDKIPGTAVSDLVNAQGTNVTGQVYNVFPNGPNQDGSPLQSELESPWFEGPSLNPPGPASGPANFGAMMQGFLQAPQTGSNYIFWIASADASELWLSTDATSANAKKIASCTSAVGFRSWTSQTTQQSSPISLVRGQQYYIQVRQKHGTGSSEFVSVGWQLPDGTLQRPISLVNVQPYPQVFDGILIDPTIVQQPVNLTVSEHQPATFSVTVNASEPVSFQWYSGRDQNPGTPINGAILGAYTIPSVNMSDSGSTFRVLMAAKTGLLFSQVVTLTVVPDVTPPTLVSASVSYDLPTQVTINFSEPVSVATATDPANYQLNNGATVFGALAGKSANSVTLLTSPLTAGVTYTISVNGVEDLATAPNSIVANSQVTFSYSLPIKIGYIDNVPGTSTNVILTSTALQNGAFTRVEFVTNLESAGSSSFDNYIGQIRAYVVPPVDGNYTFYVASDDNSILYLSTDDNPANKAPIAVVQDWTNYRQYTKFTNQKSSPITLKAGQKYYIEGDWKEGGGGDHLSITWQLPGAAAVKDNDPAIPGQYLLPYGYTSGPITIASGQPQSQTVPEGQAATFSFPLGGINGTPPYSIQWFKNGVAIPNANGGTFSLPPVFQADNGTVLTVVVSNKFSLAVSPNAVLTVKLTAPTYVAGAFFTNTVNVTYNLPIDPVSGTNAANYSLVTDTGTAVPIQAAYLATDRTVNLTANLTAGGKYLLTVTGVTDRSVPGVAMTPTSYGFVALNAPLTRINNTQTFSVDPTKNTITGGGSDIWNNADQFVFAAQPVSGNFDAIVRVESLVQVDAWSKVGIMARETLDPTNGTSRNIYALATGDTSRTPAGQNIYQFQYRDTTGGASASSGTTPAVQYPNTWVRLARVGNSFYAYYSYDAISWTQFGTADTSTFAGGVFPGTVYVGVALTSHTTSATATGTVSAFGSLPPVPVNFTFTTPPVATVGAQNGTVTFNFSGTGTNGPYVYQWQKNGVDIPGATGTSYTTPTLTLADNGATFQVVVRNSTSSQTSPAGTLTVTPDTVPPVATAAGAFLGGKIIALQWSEPLQVSSATNPSNYSITGGYRGAITSVSYRASGKTVLALNLPLGTNAISVVANGVQDLASNPSSSTVPVTVVNLTDADVGTVDPNVLSVGDIIVPSSTNSPAAEMSPNALDGNPATKYLNFDKLNAGFTVTPQVGATIVTGIQLTTANDAPERDPASFLIEGSNDGTAFSTVASGSVAHVATRLTKLPAITFTNTTPFTIYRVTFPTVFNATSANSMQVADVALLGNAISGRTTGRFTDPIEPGFGLPTSASDFEVQAGGSDIWNNADGFHFVYENMTGDFDVRVRVESLRYVSDNWAKAGLMVREDLTGGSRDLNMVVDPAKGANVWEMNYRNVANGASASFATAVGPVTYPNAWIRIQRLGNNFTFMRSTNGTAWDIRATFAPTNPYPASVYVGMCTTAHNNTKGTNTVAQYRDFDLGPLEVPKIVSVVGNPSLMEATVTFATAIDPIAATTITNYTVSGGLTISGAVLDGSGTKVSLTTSPQTPNGFYTVKAQNIPSTAGVPMAAVGSDGSFSAWAQAPGFLYREVWNGIGAPLSKLKASPFYPNAPDSVGFLPSFEAPSNVGANYSQRISGWITPTVSASYTFFLAANQQAELYLSSDATSANKALIATVANGTGSREWNKEANQKSVAIALSAGVSYYVEALQAAGTSNDNLAVTWTADGSTPANGAAPISSTYVSTYGNPDVSFLTITAQPQSVSTVKSQPASFYVAALAQQAIFYQWQEMLPGTTTWVPIAGATTQNYVIPHTAVTDSGAQFSVLVSVPGHQITSSVATLTVANDTTPPTLLSATAVANSTQVTLLFDEQMDPTLANSRLSYVVFGGYNVAAAALQPDGQTVILTLSPALTESQIVWAFNVTDLAGNSVKNPLVAIALVSAAPPVSNVAIAPPTLAIERTGSSIVLSWPAGAGSEYTLQSGSFEQDWTPVTESVVVQGGQNTVTLPIGTGTTLYRLSK